jgi:uncharacterized protein (TIGR00661 family)
MGRILYGVMGDAAGHVSRSLAVAQRLKKHEVVFVGGERACELEKSGYSVVKVPSLGTVLRENRVDIIATVRKNFGALQHKSSAIERLMGVIREFDPDLILTDYEYFLPRAARRLGRPCISIDRQHALTMCRYRPPAGHRLSRALTLGVIRALHSAARHYLVCSFVPMKPIDPALTEVLPSVLRSEVTSVRPSEGDHVVVYIRGALRDWIHRLLANRSRRYIIYGFDIDQTAGNLCFRRNSSEQFLGDLASCAYIILNGGHNAISEALHYGKPVLCFPVQLFYEQLLNAHLLAEAGYGAYGEPDSGAGAAVDAFEARLPQFQDAAKTYAPWSHLTVASWLEARLAKAEGN